MKILAIDNRPDSLAALTAMLKTFLPGCQIATAASGKEGIKQAQSFKPNTILLDIQMSDMDGFEVCKVLKSNEETRHIPVIFLTSHNVDSASRIQGLEVGGDAFLTRPVDPGELAAQVRSMIRIKQAEDMLREESKLVAQRTEALQTEMKNLDTIFDSSPVAMMVLDEKTNIVRINAAAIALAGGMMDPRNYRPGSVLQCAYSFDDPRGCGYGTVCSTCPLRMGVQSAISNGTPLRGFEQDIVARRDGKIITIWLRVSVELIQFAGRRHVIVALEDITERKEAEELLRTNKKRYDQLAEQSRTVTWEVNASGLYTFVSPVSQLVWGYAPEELEHKKYFYDLHPSQGSEKFKSDALKMFQLKQSFQDFENPILTKKGDVVWVSTNGIPVLDSAGNLLGYRGADTDITARKRMQMELQNANDILHVLRECHHALVHAPDEQQLMQEICDAIVKMGVFRMAWVGLAIEDAFKTVKVAARAGHENDYLDSVSISWHDTPLGRGPTGTAIRTGKVVVNHDFSANPTLEPWKEKARNNGYGSSIALPLTVNGKTLGAITIYSAKTNAFGEQEVKLLEDLARDLAYGLWALRNRKALAENEEQFRTMFEMASIGKAQADPATGRWLRVNQKFCSITGYSENELLQMKVPDITHPDDRQRDWQAFQRVVRGETPSYQIEKRYIRKDGSIAWVNVNMTVIRDAAGAPLRTTATIEDITDRRKVEEDHARMEAQLHQAQKMDAIGRLAGGVAHDFNNMLGVILGTSELAMLRIQSSDPLYKSLSEIQIAAQRSAALTRQLLAFARKQTVTPRVLNLNETIEGILNMLRRIIGENIRLVWKPEAVLWSVKIDAAQIDQILANLAINARDAITGSGELVVQTHNIHIDKTYSQMHPGIPPGPYVMVSVSDDGCGMDKKTQERLFEPFFTTKAVGKGTGLGLAMVYGIVNQNNGYISVYSEAGKGTTFKIYLPRHDSNQASDSDAKNHAEPPTGTETILLVEDESAVLTLSKLMLEQLGYKVLAADSPAQAIKLAAEHNRTIDLMMTDVVMPEMSGYDLHKQLAPSRPNMKCLFMSGYTADIISHHGILDKNVQLLEKPFTLQTLATKLRAVLEGKS